MNDEQSFEAVASLMVGLDVTVRFVDNAVPSADWDTKVITLPTEAKDMPMEKRLMMLSHLLHENGHFLVTKGLRKDFKNPMFHNLLEDIRIQPSVERQSSASRDLYEYSIKQICKGRVAVLKKLPKLQLLMDYVLLRSTNCLELFYSEEFRATMKKLGIWDEYLDIYADYCKYAKAENARGIEDTLVKFVSWVRKVVPYEQDERDHDRRGKEPVKDGKHKVDGQRYKIDNYPDELKKIQKERREASLDRTKSIKREKNNTDDKAEKRELNKALKKELETRKGLKEEMADELADLQSGNHPMCEKLHELEDALWDKQKQRESERIKPMMDLGNMCNLLPERVATFKQGTYSSLKRLFDKMKIIFKRDEQGKLNMNKLHAIGFDPDVFLEDVPKIDCSARAVFLVDASSSMGSKGDPSSCLRLCWNSMESLFKALHKVSSKGIADVKYSAVAFSSGYWDLKTFKEKHSEAKLKDMKKAYLGGDHWATNVYRPMRNAIKTLKGETAKRKIIFLLSDGGFDDNSIEEASWFKDMRKQGIDLFVVGIGGYAHGEILGVKSKAVNNIRDLEPALSGQIKSVLKRRR